MDAHEGRTALNGVAKEHDECPLCKSNSTITPGLRFKISPKCYHRICESCVDRWFTSGKGKCPIAGCEQYLWRREWRVQVFEDLAIERDVDIRKRVMKTLDRHEEEFETLRDYNDFLEWREDIITNLVKGKDVAATNRKLREYERMHGLTKNDLGVEEDGGPVKRARPGPGKQLAPGTDPPGFIRGLKKVAAPVAKPVYDAFGGMPKHHDYYSLRETYSSRWDSEKENLEVVVGGFDFQQFYDESLLRAFSGLGCFIEDEKGASLGPVPISVPIAVSIPGKDEDVF